MRAVVAYLVLTKKAGVARIGRTLNRFPIVVGVIVKYDAAGAASLKDDAVAGFSHDIVLNLVPAVPMIELDSVIRAAIVTAAGVETVMPIFVGISELRQDMR